tara:strand:- start:177 stop:551 length:375 start_codon:yes stop_codon:yes gene_type:complete
MIHIYKLLFFSLIFLFSINQAKSDEIFLKCIGKFEINRGELIKPDWETSYININLNGLKSTIREKNIKKEGRTLLRRNLYIIIHRDYGNRIKAIYKIHKTFGTYTVINNKTNRTLIGTCQKGRV